MGLSVYPAAASGPTLSEITTAIQNNASPYGGTIVNLGVQQGGGTSTVTFTGLGSYKRVVFYWQGIDSNGSGNFSFRVNSDSNDNYGYEGIDYTSSVSSQANVRANSIVLGGLSGSGPNNTDAVGTLTLENSNSGGYKIGKFSSTARNNAGVRTTRQYSFIWTSTASITSASFLNLSGSTFNVQSGTTAGFYAIGYN